MLHRALGALLIAAGLATAGLGAAEVTVIDATQPVPAPITEQPVDPMADVPPQADPAGDDELVDRRQRHADLIEGHPQLDGGGIAEQWKRALGAAEDAQRAVPSDESTPHLRMAELYGVQLDRQLDLDQLLDRMDVEAAVLDAFTALRDDPALDADGAKGKRAGALRGELLAALARQHAVQRDALALRHHAAQVEAEAEDRDAEAEKAGATVQALRDQLEALSGGEAQPEAPEMPAPADRNGF